MREVSKRTNDRTNEWKKNTRPTSRKSTYSAFMDAFWKLRLALYLTLLASASTVWLSMIRLLLFASVCKIDRWWLDIYATESLTIASSYFHRLALLHDKETTCHATAHFSLHSFYFYVLNFFSISLLMLMLLLLLLFSVRQLLFRISRLNKRPKGCEMNDDFISIRILYSF